MVGAVHCNAAYVAYDAILQTSEDAAGIVVTEVLAQLSMLC